MASRSLLPQAFWFKLAVPCTYVEKIPTTNDRDRLLDLPVECGLPDWGQLEGVASWAEVRVGWNARGLGISVQASGLSDQQLAPDRPEGFALAQFWIDTRDTRTVSRATRFCHRFVARIEVARSRRQLTVDVSQRPIARAQSDAPICRPELIDARAIWGSRAGCSSFSCPPRR